MHTDEKNLSVSYGTFSCHLKGFDNPLETFKQVVDQLCQAAQNNPKFGMTDLDEGTAAMETLQNNAAPLSSPAEETPAEKTLEPPPLVSPSFRKNLDVKRMRTPRPDIEDVVITSTSTAAQPVLTAEEEADLLRELNALHTPLTADDTIPPQKNEPPPPLRLTPELRINSPQPPQTPLAVEQGADQIIFADKSNDGEITPAPSHDGRKENLQENISFATFIDKINPGLPIDLVEASAAYISYIEGRTSFSRPHIFGHILNLNIPGINRAQLGAYLEELTKTQILFVNERAKFNLTENSKYHQKALEIRESLTSAPQ